jgi:hypothetical protein
MTRLHRPWRFLLALWALCGWVPTDASATEPAATSRFPSAQQRFETSQAAIEALVAAVRSGDPKRIERILGPSSGRLVRSGDAVADARARERFLRAYDAHSRVEQNGDRATLLIGENDWPFPLPLVMQSGRWGFDAASGADEVINRRIGRNELAAIQVCLAYVDAQREYASTQGNVDGLHLYAAKFVSTPGKKDGLYWPTEEGQPASPLGPLAAKAKTEGYGKSKNAPKEPYHGYLYRILTAQGPDAPGGAYDYVVKGRMIGGFGLVAYPASWGVSGVMTFIVSHDGVVHQKNLGPRTTEIASRMTRFNPDATWAKAQP